VGEERRRAERYRWPGERADRGEGRQQKGGRAWASYSLSQRTLSLRLLCRDWLRICHASSCQALKRLAQKSLLLSIRCAFLITALPPIALAFIVTFQKMFKHV